MQRFCSINERSGIENDAVGTFNSELMDDCFRNLMMLQRRVRLITWFVVAILGLIVLAYQIENWRGRVHWEETLAAIEGNGESLDWQTFVPETVPDEENAAKHPVFDEIMVVFPNGPEAGYNYCFDFTPFIERLEIEPDALIDQIAEAFERRDCQWFPPAMLTKGHYVGVPQARKVMEFIEKLQVAVMASATSHLERGDSRRARKGIVVLLNLALSFRGQTFVEQMSHLAMSRIAIRDLDELLVQDGWDERDLAAIQQALQPANQLAQIDASFQFERATMVEVLDALTRGEEWARKGLASGSTGPVFQIKSRVDTTYRYMRKQLEREMVARSYDLMPTGWYFRNMANYVEWWDTSVFQHYDRCNNRVLSPRTISPSPPSPLKPINVYNFIAASAIPQVKGRYRRAASVQSRWELLRVRCGLERFRMANDRLPASLDPLVPEFLPNLPGDLVTGARPHFDPLTGELAILDWKMTGSPSEFLCHVPTQTEKP